MLLSPLSWLLLLLHLLSSSIQQSFSQSFIYNGFKSPDSTTLTLNGIADITDDGILKLTNTSSRQIGCGFYPDPIRFKNPDTKSALSFSTAFVFSIVPKYRRLGGRRGRAAAEDRRVQGWLRRGRAAEGEGSGGERRGKMGKMKMISGWRRG